MTVEAAIQGRPGRPSPALAGRVGAQDVRGANGYFVGDRLFAVFHKGVVAAKLPDPERTKVLDGNIARPFSPTPGRPFRRMGGVHRRRRQWRECAAALAGDGL